MATLVNVKEKWSGIDGFQESPDGKTGSAGVRRSFTVLYDVPGATPLDAMSATGIPTLRESHPGNSSLRVSRINPTTLSQILFQVDAEYDVKLTDGQASTLGITDIEWFPVYTTESVDESINGEPICNPNGERYDNNEVEWADQGLRVAANVLVYNPYVATAYCNAVNSDQWGSWPPGTAKCKGIGAREMRDGNTTYFAINGEFHLRRVGRASEERRAWWLRKRCEGFRFRKFTNEAHTLWTIHNATDDNGDPVSQPILLELTGERMELPIPSAQSQGRLAEARWQEFQQFYELPFQALGFSPP